MSNNRIILFTAAIVGLLVALVLSDPAHARRDTTVGECPPAFACEAPSPGHGRSSSGGPIGGGGDNSDDSGSDDDSSNDDNSNDDTDRDDVSDDTIGDLTLIVGPGAVPASV